MIDLKSAHDFAVNLAKQAGAIARNYYNQSIAFQPKSDNSPVTEADIEINRLVIQECTKQYPDVGILGEEESSARVSEWLWVCDPIDGTIPYVLGIQASTFCLALVHDGEPVVGVVYDFLNGRLYSAIKGNGAWLNGAPLVPSTTPPLKAVNLEVWQEEHLSGDFREKLFAAGFITTQFASNTFMGMATATGRVAATVYAGPYAWDMAAAKVIAEELGCVVTDLDGKDQRYDDNINGGVIFHPAYAKELQLLLSGARRRL
ncbi:inositol monophosphatase family protein [Candidatus Saccharibacteria bacterium]|nr:inositol monophosphatase family protein [Candidatus Saccharibacteria bacterium]